MTSAARMAWRIQVSGVVQGVGFRPFVCRLARSLELSGWVRNTGSGVEIQIEGPLPCLESFLHRLKIDSPPMAELETVERRVATPMGASQFEILSSEVEGRRANALLADLAPCPECVAEFLDPRNRRHRYAFTTCTACGPRYSISGCPPFDRARTSMREFRMCRLCRTEFEDSLDRRFHSQTNACPHCGPQLELWNRAGVILANGDKALWTAVQMIKEGQVLAVKGVGGFQLVVDASNERAIQELRSRKRRPDKPFALMVRDLRQAESVSVLNSVERAWLESPQAPIVLVEARLESGLARGIAPGLRWHGVMLPSSPFHHLLLREFGAPVVATSGNISGDPICTDEREALARLWPVADAFLVHDRKIWNALDDSVVRIVGGRELLMRRARGFAPLAVPLPRALHKPLLATGAHLKNTVAVAFGAKACLSQHLGDLETSRALDHFEAQCRELPARYAVEPELVACDLHPDYASTRFAENLRRPLFVVQHHQAHVLSCAAEHSLEPPLLGVTWDGNGYGSDGSLWGGEFLVWHSNGEFTRAATLRPIPLPGGEQAIREPRRAALGCLYAIIGKALFEDPPQWLLSTFEARDIPALRSMLRSATNSPLGSSVGRLFDAAASLIGLRHKCTFEGQAAMELESAAFGAGQVEAYSIPIIPWGGHLALDWEPMIWALLRREYSGESKPHAAMRFHVSLARALGTVAERVGIQKVVLTGGVFQNRILTELAVRELRAKGFEVYWHRKVPPNDGGIALGQIFAALWSEEHLSKELPCALEFPGKL